MTKKRGLGRGLDALFSEVNKKDEVDIDLPANSGSGLEKIAIDKIQAGQYQPRRNFSESSLQELADSIKAQGVIQPIVLRTLKAGRYEIVAGERRFRAAKLANLKEIPAVIKELPDEAALAIALIENIQREDLNSIEEALSLQRLISEFSMTHEQIAKAVGKSRAAVSNLIRLLALEAEARQLLEDNQLQMGHARALLSLSGAQQIATANTIVSKALSVRETEDIIRRLQNLQKGTGNKKPVDENLKQVQTQIASYLKAKVTLQQSAEGRGKVIIKYKTPEELQRICRLMQVSGE